MSFLWMVVEVEAWNLHILFVEKIDVLNEENRIECNMWHMTLSSFCDIKFVDECSSQMACKYRVLFVLQNDFLYKKEKVILLKFFWCLCNKYVFF